MKKLFGLRIGPPKEILASLPVLDILNQKIGQTYNIFVLGKKYAFFSKFLQNHPKINEIKISDHDENLGETDFNVIKSCSYFINPCAPHLKEKDWYNYRSLIEEICLCSTIDFKLISTIPKLYFNYNIQKKYQLGIIKSNGPDQEWWNHFKKKIDFNFIEIDESRSFEEQVEQALSCEVNVGAPSDLTWTLAARNCTNQVNLVSKYKHDHTTNFQSISPKGENIINIINEESYNKINIDKTIDSITKKLYNF